MGLALLSHSSLPYSFWDHAFHTAVFLINRLPSAKSQLIPSQVLFKKPPNFHYFRIFGCACYPLLRPYNNHKLEFRSSECTFLGYSSSHHGYKCLDKSGRLYISRDVIFNEHAFPYHKRHHTTSTNHTLNTVHHSPNPLHIVTNQIAPDPPSPPNLTANNSPSPSSTPSHNTIANPSPFATPTSSTNSPLPSTSSSTIDPDSTPPHSPSPAPNTNHHSMLTRSKTGTLKPPLYPNINLTTTEPTTVQQALSSPCWTKAMHEEYNALISNNTWQLTTLPAGKTLVGCKWIFRIKQNPDGSIHKYKARLVAKGFNQKFGQDYTDTFAPVVKPVTVRIVLTLALTYKWSIQQLDVHNAFLNGTLHDDVYMAQPPGFSNTDSHTVCKLNKAIYGLKQAPRAWYESLTNTLISFGFVQSRCDPSLLIYRRGGQSILVLIYVDDILVTSSSAALFKSVITKLNAAFSLKHLGALDYFLGIECKHHSSGAISLSQAKYIRDILHRAAMDDCKSIATPLPTNLKLSKQGTDYFEDPTMYRSVVGALQYATITRPELGFAVNKVCQFMAHPLQSHWSAVKRILRYLKGTIDTGLTFTPATAACPLSVQAYCDADWASDIDDRRSTSGAAIFLGPNLISWWSRKQTLVAKSSAEAEYRSLALAASEVLWIQSLLHELQVSIPTPVIFCDNQSTVALTHNPVLHSRTKHK